MIARVNMKKRGKPTLPKPFTGPAGHNNHLPGSHSQPHPAACPVKTMER